ncbi:MAG: hypothetical protein J0G28_05105 [Afipia sp.]|nr:hypothetical protein [Afipia sp.]OJW63559.1 MAG: hypothetical protein BGO65_14140 [Afipia sp. 64-13]
MPPFILVIAGLVGGAALLRFATREARRVNRELEEARLRDLDPERAADLHHDPETGTYRPR